MCGYGHEGHGMGYGRGQCGCHEGHGQRYGHEGHGMGHGMGQGRGRQCGCHDGRGHGGYRRHFFAPEEEIQMLQEYKEQLMKEQAGVEARIKELEAKSAK